MQGLVEFLSLLYHGVLVLVHLREECVRFRRSGSDCSTATNDCRASPYFPKRTTAALSHPNIAIFRIILQCLVQHGLGVPSPVSAEIGCDEAGSGASVIGMAPQHRLILRYRFLEFPLL